MIKGILTRLQDDGVQTLGRLHVYNGIDQLMEACTLELSDKSNQRNISCIPRGTYTVTPRKTEKRGWHFEITGVPGRTFILIHPGNYYTHIQGCVLLGDKHVDINRDNRKDVANSTKTCKTLWDSIGQQEWQLQII
ncbi:DUF5675 family protein [Limibacter armeniacum]|uniref:DUF5675 family protein n=1 Tax=Limibacter armeniacum TaxID=466084 RepID=UPI002FE56285